MVYRSPQAGCGIHIFQQHLVTAMRHSGIDVASCNIAIDEYKASEITLLHYSPAMWEGHTGLLENLLERAAPGVTMVVLHSLQPPHVQEYLSECPCVDIARHLSAMLRAHATVVSLSVSCTRCLDSWGTALSASTVTCTHPGLFAQTQRTRRPPPYAFFGGVIRPKKDPTADTIRTLLECIQDVGVDVWIHSSNKSHVSIGRSAHRVWRETIGVMDDIEWSEAVSLARVVLCPYDTRMQCVSGLVAEAVSAGTFVIATSFPFAVELASECPGHVRVENDLRVWPAVTARLAASVPMPAAGVPSWLTLVRTIDTAARYAEDHSRNA